MLRVQFRGSDMCTSQLKWAVFCMLRHNYRINTANFINVTEFSFEIIILAENEKKMLWKYHLLAVSSRLFRSDRIFRFYY
jgi:hypothetical protein